MAAQRDAELEARIREHRSDPGPYLVYADWLQQQGSPFGELIVLQHAVEQAADADTQSRIDALITGLDLPPNDLSTYGWRRGFWQWLRIENSRDWMDAQFKAVPLAAGLFASPACAALEELRIGVLRWEYNAQDVPAVVAEAARHPWAASLVRLHLGNVDHDIDMAHHVIGEVGAAITAAFPALSSLTLHSGAQDWDGDHTLGFAGLALPRLTELVIETCSMSKARLAEVMTDRMPAVERLELWFGSANYGSDCGAEDLRHLLEGRLYPRVVRLGLRNAEFTDALALVLPSSRLAARLEHLDLSLGTLNDDAALELSRRAERFPRLVRLDVSDNFLTLDGLAALRARFAQCDVVSTRQKRIDGDLRYVSIGE